MFRRLLAALLSVVFAASVLVLSWPQLFWIQRVAGIA